MSRYRTEEPFGVEIPGGNTGCDNTHRFTGHERDAETGNDYMHFRYYGVGMGRFMKPDSNFDGAGRNPQGFNLYSYVRGNPVNFNDPTGHYMNPNPLGQGRNVGTHESISNVWVNGINMGGSGGDLTHVVGGVGVNNVVNVGLGSVIAVIDISALSNTGAIMGGLSIQSNGEPLSKDSPLWPYLKDAAQKQKEEHREFMTGVVSVNGNVVAVVWVKGDFVNGIGYAATGDEWTPQMFLGVLRQILNPLLGKGTWKVDINHSHPEPDTFIENHEWWIDQSILKQNLGPGFLFPGGAKGFSDPEIKAWHDLFSEPEVNSLTVVRGASAWYLPR
jgi:RHS repeat-associated protein